MTLSYQRYLDEAAVGKTSDECWEVPALPSGKRRVCWFEGKDQAIYRIAWMLVHGVIPDGLHVCHKCDNPNCVNISHLFLGTASDNAMDNVRKGRGNLYTGDAHRLARGEKSSRGVFTQKQADEMRVLRNNGMSIAKLSIQYKVSERTIYRVLGGYTYTDSR